MEVNLHVRWQESAQEPTQVTAHNPIHVPAQPVVHNSLQVNVQPREHSFTQLDLHKASQFPSQELGKGIVEITCACE